MALRQIRMYGDEILTKVCRPVKLMTPRTAVLIQDMLETMYDADGVGLAAPQVGVLRRVIVIDVGDGPLVLINPEIIETSGEQTGQEGCLSLPGKAGDVTRPSHIKVKAQNQEMEEFTLEADDLLARAICHECDHLDGIMYVDKVIGDLYDVEDAEESEKRDRDQEKEDGEAPGEPDHHDSEDNSTGESQ